MRNLPPPARTYEFMTILSPDVPEEMISSAVDEIGGYITAAGGTIAEVLRESPWGRRRLAYPIRHAGRDVRDGYYTVYHVELAPGSVIDVERDLKLNERVMRYLVTQHTLQPIEPRAEGEVVAAEQPAAVAVQAEPETAEPAEPAAPEPTVSATEVEEPPAAATASEPESESATAEVADDAVPTAEVADVEEAPASGPAESVVEAETEAEAETSVEAVSETNEDEPVEVVPETEAQADNTSPEAEAADEKPEE